MSGKQGLWTPSPSIKYLHMRHCFSTESLHFAGRYGCIWWCRWYCGMGILGLQHCFRCGVWVLGATSKVGGQCRLGRTITMDEWHFLQPVVWNYCLVWRFQVASRYLDKAKHLYLKLIQTFPVKYQISQMRGIWTSLCKILGVPSVSENISHLYVPYCWYVNNLVGGFKHFLFFHILGIIIPTE